MIVLDFPASLSPGANMIRIFAALVFVVALTPFFGQGSAVGQAGPEKTPAWKQFLPADACKELVKRSTDRVHVLAKDAEATNALRAEALMLAGYSISTRDPTASAGLRHRAIKVATLAAQKDGDAQARKLAAELAPAKSDAKAVIPTIDWIAAIGDVVDLMTPLATKAKGGEGIATELQYLAKVRSQNGTEALLLSLATKQLSVANSGKMAKELELVGYRLATIGALARRRGPTRHKDETKLWEEQATIMRDVSIELAEAARKKDITAILGASKRLVSSCAECHATFKK
jgi:hypothetical protein